MSNSIYNILEWYFNKRAVPYWTILIMDCLIVFFSGYLIYFLYYRGYQTLLDARTLMHSMLIYVFFSLVSFKIFRTYSGIVRFSSFVDLQKVGYANLLAFFLSFLAHYFLMKYPQYFAIQNTRMLLMLFIVATIIMWGVRLLVKALYDITVSGKDACNVLIYGVKSGGIGLAKNIRSVTPHRFTLRGFITSDDTYKHNLLMGEKVYSVNDNLSEVIDKNNIKGVVVSPLRNDEFRMNTKLQDLFISKGVKIYMSSGIREWKEDDDFSQAQLKEVSVEDLLPRKEIKVDMESVGRELTGMKILITGSAGSIGSEIVRQVAKYKPAMMMLIDQAETPEHDIRLMMHKDFPDVSAETVVTSICKQDRMEKVFSDFRPDYVFHAAAYKHVPMMEDNPSEAVQNNIVGTKVIADLSVKYGVKKFVMISTDKAVNPTNVMGCSKRICEIYVQSLGEATGHKTQFVTTRFGNVLGSNGSVIPLFKEQIKNGGPVTVTHKDIIRFFMLISEACKLVLEAGTKGKGGEIFVFDMGEPVRIADLAKRMILLSGAKNVKIEYTGLRDGEKLYEEVLNEKEGTKPSFHEKIRIADVRKYDYDDVCKQIDELISIAAQYDDMATVKKMKEIVPEYKSQHSKYEILDND